MPYDSLGIWHDPANGRFAPRGFSTLKRLAMVLLKGGLTRDRIQRDGGSGKARVADNLLKRVGINKGDVIDVAYKDENYASVTVTTKAGKKRKYDVQWARFDDAYTPDGSGDEGMPVVTEKQPVKVTPQPAGLKLGAQYLGPKVEDLPYETKVPVSFRRRADGETDVFAKDGLRWASQSMVQYDSGLTADATWDLLDADGNVVGSVSGTTKFPRRTDDAPRPPMTDIQKEEMEKVVQSFIDDQLPVQVGSKVLLHPPGVEDRLAQTEHTTVDLLDGEARLVSESNVGRFERLLDEQRLAKLLNPAQVEPTIVHSDAVIMPGQLGAMRDGRKITFARFAARDNLYYGTAEPPDTPFTLGRDHSLEAVVMDDTQENWTKAQAFLPLLDHPWNPSNSEEELNDQTVGQAQVLLQSARVEGDKIILPGREPQPIDDFIETIFPTTVVKNDGAKNPTDLAGSTFHKEKWLGSGSSSPAYKVSLTGGRSLVKVLQSLYPPGPPNNPFRFGPGVPNPKMPRYEDGAGRQYGPVAGFRPTALRRATDAELEAGKGGVGTGAKELPDGPLGIITLENDNGDKFEAFFRLNELSWDDTPTDAEIAAGLKDYQEKWDRLGGSEWVWDSPPVEGVNWSLSTGTQFSGKRDYGRVMVGIKGLEMYGFQRRKKWGERIAPYAPVVMPRNDRDGWDIVLKNGDRYHYTATGDLFKQTNDTPDTVTYSSGQVSGKWSDNKTATLRGASPDDVRSFLLGVTFGYSAAETKRKLKQGVSFEENESGSVVAMKGDYPPFMSTSHLDSMLLDEQTQAGVVSEIESLGTITPDSFTADGFAQLAKRVLKVGHDNAKSKIKPIKIDGGGKWTSQGADLSAQQTWLQNFPIVETMKEALGTYEGDLPADPREMVPVPPSVRERVLNLSKESTQLGALFREAELVNGIPVMRTPELKIEELPDGTMRAPAAIVALAQNLAALNVANQRRNVRDDLIGNMETMLRGSIRSLLTSPEEYASWNSQMTNFPEGTDYRTFAQMIYQAQVDADPNFKDRLAKALLDTQNGAWAQSSQSHFSTAQMYAAVEMMGATPEDFEAWNRWSLGRRSNSGYSVVYTPGEMMMARLVTLSTYSLTQHNLEQRGLKPDDVVFLTRGSSEDAFKVALALDQEVRVTTNPLASHATRASVAGSFGGGGQVMGLRVPRSRIFSYANTGPGTYKEYEVVVMGDPEGLRGRAVNVTRNVDAQQIRADLRTFVDPVTLPYANTLVGSSKPELGAITALMKKPVTIADTPSVIQMGSDDVQQSFRDGLMPSDLSSIPGGMEYGLATEDGSRVWDLGYGMATPDRVAESIATAMVQSINSLPTGADRMRAVDRLRDQIADYDFTTAGLRVRESYSMGGEQVPLKVASASDGDQFNARVRARLEDELYRGMGLNPRGDGGTDVSFVTMPVGGQSVAYVDAGKPTDYYNSVGFTRPGRFVAVDGNDPRIAKVREVQGNVSSGNYRNGWGSFMEPSLELGFKDTVGATYENPMTPEQYEEARKYETWDKIIKRAVDDLNGADVWDSTTWEQFLEQIESAREFKVKKLRADLKSAVEAQSGPYTIESYTKQIDELTDPEWLALLQQPWVLAKLREFFDDKISRNAGRYALRQAVQQIIDKPFTPEMSQAEIDDLLDELEQILSVVPQ